MAARTIQAAMPIKCFECGEVVPARTQALFFRGKGVCHMHCSSEPPGPDTQVEHLGFTPRTTHALVKGGVKTLSDIQAKGFRDLFDIKGLGRKGQHEVAAVLFEDHGINLTVFGVKP